jgi:hypothetical protein
VHQTGRGLRPRPRESGPECGIYTLGFFRQIPALPVTLSVRPLFEIAVSPAVNIQVVEGISASNGCSVMTLILARASGEFVIQVTDRLVTNTKTGQPFDRVANKNILCFASNALVAIAYTGDAYLDGVPTDHWIAEKLAGIKIDPNNPPMMQGGQNETRRDVGQAFRHLSDELSRQDQRKRLYLLISVQGWQWDSKGRLRPIVGYITKMPPQNAFGIHYEPRDWYLSGAQTISAPEANLSAEELTELSNSCEPTMQRRDLSAIKA